jgi:hypothetical protein
LRERLGMIWGGCGGTCWEIVTKGPRKGPELWRHPVDCGERKKFGPEVPFPLKRVERRSFTSIG